MYYQGGIHQQRGFTLIELTVTIAVFILIAVGIYSGIQFIFKVVFQSRVIILETAIANEQIEQVRSLPYGDVGVVGSIPNGSIPGNQTVSKNGQVFSVQTTIRNIDDPFDGTIGGIPNDTAPADYKLIEIAVLCTSCTQQKPVILSTRVAPKGLETANGNGALFLHVFNAEGIGVPQANVTIQNVSLNININDVTNNTGMLQILDLPPAVEGYTVSTTKEGFSTDGTVSATPDNPNPLKPPATIAGDQITQLSLRIDRVGKFQIQTVNANCASIGNIPFTLHGSKRIGENPDVYKYQTSLQTNPAGKKTIPNLEWDTYHLTISTATYDLTGAIPALPVTLPPNTNTDISVVLEPHSTHSLQVTVHEADTILPLSGAKVQLLKEGFSATQFTGQGFIQQTDWLGGAGQELYVDETRYAMQDGNIDTSSAGPGSGGDIQLIKNQGVYQESGFVESSTMDSAGSNNYTVLTWEPLAQPASTTVRFQIASSVSETPATWQFVGPDGTANSFYTESGSTIAASHTGNRYFRYRVYLSTTDQTATPQISDIAIHFTSSCTPPGQTFFKNLESGNYTVTISASGYGTYTDQLSIQGNESIDVGLSP